MTFGARTFQGMGVGTSITSPTFTGTNTSASSGLRSTGFILNTDGTISFTGAGGSGSTTWASPTGTGAGTGIWVKATITSAVNTSVTGSTTGVWTQLTSSFSLSFQNSSATVEGVGGYTLSFAADSGGVNIIGSGSGNWDVGNAH